MLMATFVFSAPISAQTDKYTQNTTKLLKSASELDYPPFAIVL